MPFTTTSERPQPFLIPPHVSGRLYSGTWNHNALSTDSTPDVLKAVPIFIPKTNTYTVLGVEATVSGAGAFFRVGIYQNSGGAPGALVVDGGEKGGSGAAFYSTTISQQLTGGTWYWLASVIKNVAVDATLRALPASSCMVANLGFTSNTDTSIYNHWEVAFTYAALPDPFTGGGALATTVVPRILIGY